MIIRKLRSLAQRKAHAARNLRLAGALSPIGSTDLGNGLFIQGCAPEFYKRFEQFYLSLDLASADFLKWQRPFLRPCANKLVFLVGRGAGNAFEPVGVSIYYFNERDERDGTVHEAYIGLSEDARGLGLGSQLRAFAIAHFQGCGLKGISSKITTDNAASLHSARKNRFEIVEEFHDPGLQQQRYYLIRPLSVMPPPQVQ